MVWLIKQFLKFKERAFIRLSHRITALKIPAGRITSKKSLRSRFPSKPTPSENTPAEVEFLQEKSLQKKNHCIPKSFKKVVLQKTSPAEKSPSRTFPAKEPSFKLKSLQKYIPACKNSCRTVPQSATSSIKNPRKSHFYGLRDNTSDLLNCLSFEPFNFPKEIP